MPKPVTFRVASRAAGRRAIDVLARLGPSRALDRGVRHTTYLDTFDWRVMRAGARLTVDEGGGGSHLVWTDGDGTARHRVPVGDPPAFAWDLPASPARQTLEQVIDVRRLLPRVTLTIESRGVALLDDRAKTVCRLLLEHGTVAAPDGTTKPARLAPVLRVVPVRGYAQALAETWRRLDGQTGLTLEPRGELERGLAAIGREPCDIPVRQAYDIELGLSAGEAMKRIHHALLATFRLNLPGLRGDLDSEFLHDARVAVRRTRSALGQVPGVFPEADVTRFKEGFSWLGAITGPPRDMDVWMLQLPGYVAALPEARRPDLEPLQALIQAERAAAQRGLVDELASERFESLMREWSAFLEVVEPEATAPPGAARPVVDVARERIWRAWRRVLRRGRHIEPDSPAALLHRLRIDCKKLRYLLEFFGNLFPEGSVTPLVGALKRLQTNLGDLNDLEVQRETLRGFEEQLVARGAAPGTTEAIERLVAGLLARRRVERALLDDCFAAFAAEEIEAAFRRLFAPPADAAP